MGQKDELERLAKSIGVLARRADQPTISIDAADDRARRGASLPIADGLASLLRAWFKEFEPNDQLWPGNWNSQHRSARIIRLDLEAHGWRGSKRRARQRGKPARRSDKSHGWRETRASGCLAFALLMAGGQKLPMRPENSCQMPPHLRKMNLQGLTAAPERGRSQHNDWDST